MKHFKAYVTTFADPDLIDDASEVYGDNTEEVFPVIDTPCEKSPVGQCQYDALRFPERCIHCGRVT